MSLFITDKEINFVHSINEEIIEDILKEFIIVFKVNPEFSEFDDTYGESPNKAFDPGIKIYCLVRFLEPSISTTAAGVSQERSIEAYIHRKHLTDNNFYFEEGDYVLWDDQYFEINHVSEPQLFDGMPENKHQVRIEAKSAGISEITILEREVYKD